MALVDNTWYVNFGNGTSTGYYAVTAWATGTVKAAGALVRQLAAPAVGSERVFVCVVAGTTHATTEPTWVTTRGGKTTDNTVTWQECTGIAALNGDATNTPSWTITATPPGGVKNTAVTLGQVIKRDSGASYQIATTAGTAGNGAEPAFSNTAGTTTADNTVTWTSLGVVGNFTGWQAPHARLANAFTATWGQVGNSFYVGSNHAETQATAITATAPGTLASPNFIYCVNSAGSLPPVSADLRTTGSITTTGNSGITLAGSFYIYGMIISCGSGAVAPQLRCTNAAGSTVYDSCALIAAGTIAQFIIPIIGSSSTRCVFINTTVQFGSTGSSIAVQSSGGQFIWQNTPSAIAGATIPTSLFGASNTGFNIFIQGVDLGALGANTLFIAASSGGVGVLVDCKLGASATLATPSTSSATYDLVRCDSGATNYRDERYWYQGTQTVETTIIRTGGATDGTTPISWKLVATANSRWTFPFESQRIMIWNDRTTAITTLTIYGTTTGGGVPNNDDIWVEVEYLSSSLTPQGSFITTTKADNLAASVTTNNSADASIWGGGGVGNGFKMVVPSFTPGMKGPLNIVIHVAKVSATYYIDPKPVIT